MNIFKITAALSLAWVLNACATVPAETSEPESPPPEPEVIKVLPPTVDTFELQGYKHFEDGSGGYSVRYANKKKRRIADLYIYPVAEENIDLEHNQLVLGSTRATLMAIGEAARQGHYSNFNVLNAATRAQGLRTIARVKATYLRQNLASYTLVYQTEHKGTLLKVRMNMPDNESNRASSEWDRFAERLFDTVIQDIDSKDTKGADQGNRSADKISINL